MAGKIESNMFPLLVWLTFWRLHLWEMSYHFF